MAGGDQRFWYQACVTKTTAEIKPPMPDIATEHPVIVHYPSGESGILCQGDKIIGDMTSVVVEYVTCPVCLEKLKAGLPKAETWRDRPPML